MNILNKIIKTLLTKHQGKLDYQSTFQFLYRIGLSGMNIGGGWNVDESGEVDSLNHIKSILPNNRDLVLFDVGANKGDYVLMLKKIFKDKAIVHAFEPSGYTFQLLKDNIADPKNVYLHNLAFGEKSDQLTLYFPDKGAGLASLYNRRLDHFGIDSKETEEVQVKTLDKFCQEQEISEIDFLKLDVEGHELSVLKGAHQMLKSNKIHVIQFEFGGCNIDSRTFFQDFYYLLSSSYNFYRIVKDGLFPISEYSEDLEIFKNSNYLCISKFLN